MGLAAALPAPLMPTTVFSPTDFSVFGAALAASAALAAGAALAIARGLAAGRDTAFAGAVRGRGVFGDTDEAGRAEAWPLPAADARRYVGFGVLEAEELDFRLKLDPIRLPYLRMHMADDRLNVCRRGGALVHDKVSVNRRDLRPALAKTL